MREVEFGRVGQLPFHRAMTHLSSELGEHELQTKLFQSSEEQTNVEGLYLLENTFKTLVNMNNYMSLNVFHTLQWRINKWMTNIDVNVTCNM